MDSYVFQHPAHTLSIMELEMYSLEVTKDPQWIFHDGDYVVFAKEFPFTVGEFKVSQGLMHTSILGVRLLSSVMCNLIDDIFPVLPTLAINPHINIIRISRSM